MILVITSTDIVDIFKLNCLDGYNMNVQLLLMGIHPENRPSLKKHCGLCFWVTTPKQKWGY